MTSHDSEQSLSKLLKFSGKRDVPSTERTEFARKAARDSWQRMLEKNNKPQIWRRHWLKFSIALAASLVCVLFIPFRTIPPVIVAQVTAIEGDTPMVPGFKLSAGAQLTTDNSRIALTLGQSLSLRLDQHTKLRINDAGRVSLSEGRIYVDSGGLNSQVELCIVTPAGEVRHLGTQFQVSIQGDTTSVRVREGRVQLSSRDSHAQYISTAEELQVTGSHSMLQHGLSSYGVDWEWATAIAPILDIENRPLAEFLSWTAREHGWQLRYSSEALQQRTHEIRLHGSLTSMRSTEAMERISLITGVSIIAQDGALLVGYKKAHQ